MRCATERARYLLLLRKEFVNGGSVVERPNWFVKQVIGIDLDVLNTGGIIPGLCTLEGLIRHVDTIDVVYYVFTGVSVDSRLNAHQLEFAGMNINGGFFPEFPHGSFLKGLFPRLMEAPGQREHTLKRVFAAEYAENIHDSATGLNCPSYNRSRIGSTRVLVRV